MIKLHKQKIKTFINESDVIINEFMEREEIDVIDVKVSHSISYNAADPYGYEKYHDTFIMVFYNERVKYVDSI